MAEVYDVIIVGAGPAGSTAAAFLAQSGLKVLLIDKAKFPRNKVCGGGLVWKAFELLPKELWKVSERFCSTVELHFARSALSFSVTRQYPIITMVDRKKLDSALAEYASQKGTIFRDSFYCRGIKDEDINYIKLATSRGDVKTRFVIASDGVISRIARSLRLPEERKLIHAIETGTEIPKPNHIECPRFDFDVCPGGYGWAFPKKDHLSVGVLSYIKGIRLKYYLKAYLKKLGINSFNLDSAKGALIPVTPRRKFMSLRRILFTGDSLGWVDPIAAEGISGAMRSGKLASEAILKGNLNPTEVHKNYRKFIQKHLLDNFPFSSFLARIVYYHPSLRDACFKLYGREISEVFTDIISGKKSYKWLLWWPFNYLQAFYLFPQRAYEILKKKSFKFL